MGAVVEKGVLADGREWLLVLFARRKKFVVGTGVGLRLGSTSRTALLVGLPVCLLTVFVAVGNRLAAGTFEERHVGGIARGTGLSFGHFRSVGIFEMHTSGESSILMSVPEVGQLCALLHAPTEAKIWRTQQCAGAVAA